MSRKVHRFIPTSLWNTSIIEAWLSDMAGKGLFVLELGRDLATFTKGQPREVQYKIDMYPSLTEEDFENKISQYNNNGFNYECTYENFHVFFAKKPYNNSEANSIIEGNPDILKPLLKETITNNYFGLTLIAIVIIMNLFLLYKSFHKLSNPMIFLILVFFVLLICYIIYTFTELLELKRLKKSICDGSCITTHSNWKRRYYITMLTKISLPIFYILLFLYWYLELINFITLL